MQRQESRLKQLLRDEEKRGVAWLLIGAVVAPFLLLQGQTLTEALMRCGALGCGAHLIDYGVFAGLVRKNIRQSNRQWRSEDEPRYKGKAAIAFGIVHILFGAALLAFAFLLPHAG